MNLLITAFVLSQLSASVVEQERDVEDKRRLLKAISQSTKYYSWNGSNLVKVIRDQTKQIVGLSVSGKFRDKPKKIEFRLSPMGLVKISDLVPRDRPSSRYEQDAVMIFLSDVLLDRHRASPAADFAIHLRDEGDSFRILYDWAPHQPDAILTARVIQGKVFYTLDGMFKSYYPDGS